MENSVEQDKKRKVPVIEVDERQLRAHVSEVVRQSVEKTLTYCDFPSAHWRNLHTMILQRLNRKIRSRARVAGSFPDGHAALMLASARLPHMTGQKWGAQRYLTMHTEE